VLIVFYIDIWLVLLALVVAVS